MYKSTQLYYTLSHHTSPHSTLLLYSPSRSCGASINNDDVFNVFAPTTLPTIVMTVDCVAETERKQCQLYQHTQQNQNTTAKMRATRRQRPRIHPDRAHETLLVLQQQVIEKYRVQSITVQLYRMQCNGIHPSRSNDRLLK
jgi:hypothetical protein